MSIQRSIASNFNNITSPFGRRSVERFNPITLFANGEQGAWYDPSDLSTMFTDTAGTTPAAVGDPVALLLDKSQGLELGPELVENGGDPYTDTTGYEGVRGSLTIDAGSLVFTRTGTGVGGIRKSLTLVVGKTYLIEWGGGDGSTFRVAEGTSTPGNTFADGSAGRAIYTAEFADASFWFRQLSSTVGDTISIDRFSVRELAGNHARQETAAARPTLTAGTPNFLRSDLVDDAILWTAPAGTDYTIARLNSAGVVTILTEQSLSGSTDIFLEQDIAAYIAVNRALTAGETSGLTSYLEGL